MVNVKYHYTDPVGFYKKRYGRYKKYEGLTRSKLSQLNPTLYRNLMKKGQIELVISNTDQRFVEWGRKGGLVKTGNWKEYTLEEVLPVAYWIWY